MKDCPRVFFDLIPGLVWEPVRSDLRALLRHLRVNMAIA